MSFGDFQRGLYSQSEFWISGFGVEDQTHIVKGTSFKAKSHKKGGEDLEHWLTTRLNPKTDFTVYEFDYDETRHISLYVIPAAKNQPVEFLHQSYIRIGSITRRLNEYPEKQAKIWKKDVVPFEKEIAMEDLSAADIIRYLSTETYFDLLKLPYPSTQQGVVDKFIEEGFVVKNSGYAITKLGALLFAKQLRDFESVGRKSIRVVVYKGKNKVETAREQIGGRGYALGFEGLAEWINGQLPANEEIGKALRKESRMYPEVAIRELVANALVHQDLNEKGFPMVEIFSDRIEISNPGTPLVTPERFIDSYVSRNDKLADVMRRMGFCEEKGSGLDKVIFNIELYQHACLKYVSNEKMTNQSLRERFQIANQNSAMASRIIKDSLEEGYIKKDDPESKSKKYLSYLPIWA